eukprot:1086516-Rhodomonas_salina.2
MCGRARSKSSTSSLRWLPRAPPGVRETQAQRHRDTRDARDARDTERETERHGHRDTDRDTESADQRQTRVLLPRRSECRERCFLTSTSSFPPSLPSLPFLSSSLTSHPRPLFRASSLPFLASSLISHPPPLFLSSSPPPLLLSSSLLSHLSSSISLPLSPLLLILSTSFSTPPQDAPLGGGGGRGPGEDEARGREARAREGCRGGSCTKK